MGLHKILIWWICMASVMIGCKESEYKQTTADVAVVPVLTDSIQYYTFMGDTIAIIAENIDSEYSCFLKTIKAIKNGRVDGVNIALQPWSKCSKLVEISVIKDGHYRKAFYMFNLDTLLSSSIKFGPNIDFREMPEWSDQCYSLDYDKNGFVAAEGANVCDYETFYIDSPGMGLWKFYKDGKLEKTTVYTRKSWGYADKFEKDDN